jgi:hypothetical protein
MKRVNKQNHSTKRLKKVGLFLLIFLILHFALRLFNFFIGACHKSDTSEGWYCYHEVLSVNCFITKILENHYKNRCIQDSGELYSRPGGRGMHFNCYIPFTDSGHPCKNSNECKGRCEYRRMIPDSCIKEKNNVYFCPKGITGTCSKSTETTFYREVIDGRLYEYFYFLAY